MWIWNVRFEGRIAIFLKQGVVDPPCRQGDFKSLKIHAPGKGGKNTLFLLTLFDPIISIWVVRVQVAWTDVFGQSREGFCEHLDRKMLISVQNRPDWRWSDQTSTHEKSVTSKVYTKTRCFCLLFPVHEFLRIWNPTVGVGGQPPPSLKISLFCPQI